MSRTLTRCAALAAILIAPQALPAFAAAPKQLYNKTIQFGWTVGVTQTNPEGRTNNVSVGVSHTIYVSSAGRLFAKSSRSTRKGNKTLETAPGASHNADGEARGSSFQGNRLVGVVAFAQGARQYTVTFDPSFSSCTVAVQFGRGAGGYKRKGVDGVMYTIQSISASGETCSIREGNAFAN